MLQASISFRVLLLPVNAEFTQRQPKVDDFYVTADSPANDVCVDQLRNWDFYPSIVTEYVR